MKLICSLAWVFLLATSALAQSASLRGRVLDESGAVVPGAKVALAGPGGFAKTATSSADGAYSFRDLPPGNYNGSGVGARPRACGAARARAGRRSTDARRAVERLSGEAAGDHRGCRRPRG